MLQDNRMKILPLIELFVYICEPHRVTHWVHNLQNVVLQSEYTDSFLESSCIFVLK
jgi:hypothetical protein